MTMAMISRRMITAGQRYPDQKSAMRAGLLLRRRDEVDLGAWRHRLRGAADRVGHVVVGDRQAERRRIDRTVGAERAPRGGLDRVEPVEVRMVGIEPGMELGEAVERQRAAERLRPRAHDRPGLARLA